MAAVGRCAATRAASTTVVLAPTYVSSGVGGKPTVEFASVNVQILSGSGSTSGTVNGEGNLILGYDEQARAQTGSHNLIIGTDQSYTSYSSIIGGLDDTSTSNDQAVFGYANTAAGHYAAVTGGRSNTASGSYSSVGGGYLNTAAAVSSAVTGGCDNLAGGDLGSPPSPPSSCDTAAYYPSIAGGEGNQATGADASVSGGRGSSAQGGDATVSGGHAGVASGQNSDVSGGFGNIASADASAVQRWSSARPMAPTRTSPDQATT
jgi:hypothetical protein